MRDTSSLGPWVRRFLLEHLVGERNLARNTQRSYRDTLRLLLPFVARRTRKPVDRLAVTEVSADRVRQFLTDLEEGRKCGIATRNQRLAAIHALARFVGLHAPELVEWCGQVRAVPFKKAPRSLITYLEKPEMDALLAAPDRATAQGRRDHALLLFLYNTGARADEAAQSRFEDLALPQVPGRDPASVVIRGKGNKRRRCPLWEQTVGELSALVLGRGPDEHVFLNRRGQPITRFGVHTLVKRSAARAAGRVPSLAAKQVSPHVIRHTAATHLLRAGVDINTIRAWLGHMSLATTNVYAEVDLEMVDGELSLARLGGGQEDFERYDREEVVDACIAAILRVVELWQEWPVEAKVRIQQLVFPRGFDHQVLIGCRTPQLSLLYAAIPGSRFAQSNMAPPTCPVSNFSLLEELIR